MDYTHMENWPEEIEMSCDNVLEILCASDGCISTFKKSENMQSVVEEMINNNQVNVLEETDTNYVITLSDKYKSMVSDLIEEYEK